MAKTKLPALKNIPPKTDRELKIALDAIKEALEVRLGQRGDPLDRAVTLRELSDNGIVQVKNKKVGVSGGISQPPGTGGSTTPPPAPSTLEASAAFTSITLSWTKASYGNHSYSEIWRSQDNALGGAARIANTNAFVYTDEVGYNQEYYYWVRYVSASDVAGPWNDTEGTSATTAVDVGAVMQQLSEELANLPGFSTLQNDITVNVDGVSSSLASALGTLDTAAASAQSAANSAQSAANAAQTTANAITTNATRVIKSTSAPTQRADGTALQAHDIWVDTDDNNQVYARNSSNNGWEKARDATLVSTIGSASFSGSDLTTAMASAQGSIATLTTDTSSNATAINQLETNIDLRNRTFISASAPTATNTGDLWIDSDDNNKLYRWNGSSWVAVNDTSGIAVYAQNSQPTGSNVGDLWFDTDDNNKQYRYNGTAWVAVDDSRLAANSTAITQLQSTTSTQGQSITTNATAITNLQSTLTGYSGSSTVASAISGLQTQITNNDGDITSISGDVSALQTSINLRNRTFISTSAPTADNTGDLWIDSDDNNKLYRWNGSSWVAVNDTSGIAVYAQNSEPTGNNEGDLWFDTDDNNKQYRYNGSAWVAVDDSRLAANSTAIGQLQTTTSTQGQSISTNATAITALQSTLTGYSGSSTVASAISGLQTQIDNNDGDISSIASDVSALETTIDVRNRTFVQTSAPTADNAGDLWIDSDDNNKLYRWNGSSWVAVNDTSGIAVYAQTSEPTGSNVGDLWFDTDDNNKQYRYNGTAWVAVDDARLAANASAISGLQTATNTNAGDISTLSGQVTQLETDIDLRNRTFISTSAPTATNTGDIWIDSDDNNKLYRWSGSAWVAVNDTSGIAVYAQNSQPSGSNAGDLWFDTDDNNKQYRYNGSAWVAVDDLRLAANASAISDLQTTTSTNAGNISTNATAIQGLETNIDLRNRTFIQTSAPTASNAGDLWIDSDDNNKLYRWSGSAWVAVNDTSGIAIYAQNSQPTGANVGDIWYDTDANNRVYRWNGSSWVEVTDTRTASNASAITQLQTDTSTNAGNITTNASAITNLQAAISGYTGSGAIASAFNSTNANVSTNAGNITANTNSITALQATVGLEFGVRIKTTNTSKTVTIQTVTNSAGSTTTSAHGISSADVTAGAYITLVGATAVGGITTTQLNKTHKIQSVPNTTSLTIEITGDAATSTTAFSSYTATVNNIIGAYAGVAELANATADLEGNAQASYVLQVAANGSVAGMVIEANASDGGTASSVQFQADKFAIWNGSSSSAPFIVDSGVVYIDTARIKDGSIAAAKIGSLSADVITTGAMSAERITSGTMDAARISGGVIQSTDLSTSGSTTINGDNITTGTVDAQFLDADLIVSTDLGASGSTVIDGSRITTGQIDADRINVTDLSLPTVNKKVTGTTIGGFQNDTMRLAQVGEIGTEPGVYIGYVRVFGGNGQVKTLSIAAGDGTYGSSGTQLLSTGNAYNNGPNSSTLPMADTGGLQYHSNRAEYWSGIARFQTTNAIAQLSVTFIKRSANTVPTNLYIHAQGDGGTRYLTSVEYAFQRLTLNEPNQFTFTDLTNQATSTTFTSNTITLTGSGFSGGTATVSGGTGAQYKLNSGSYQSPGSFTVTNGDTITLKNQSSSSGGVTTHVTLTVNGITDQYSVTTTGGSSPPPFTPPGGPGGGPLP